ncbi:MAG: sel1 repeat family protein [Gammaproteobacteria bacterium]|nr:sel1 repeat family protein [Gammaproteobacteria bacterium]
MRRPGRQAVLVSLLTLTALSMRASASTTELLTLCRSVPPNPPALAFPRDPTDAYLNVVYGRAILRQIDACRTLLTTVDNDLDLHFYLGRLLGLAGEEEQAISHLRIAATAGSAKSITALGSLVERGLLSREAAGQDFRAFYEDAAARGDPVAQVRLALTILKDHQPSTAESHRRMVELLQRAAAQGDALAEFYLGHLYQFPAAGKPDEKLAAQHYERAAQGGVRAAVERLELLNHDVSSYVDLDEMTYQIASPDEIRRP